MRCTAIAKLKFEVPEEFLKGTIRIGVSLPKDVLYQIQQSKDEFIYGITKKDMNVMHVLTPKGLDFVQEKYVESKL